MSGLTDLPIPSSTNKAPQPGGFSNDYLSVKPDGRVELRSGKVDIGQGITTALARIAADGLSVSPMRVRITHTDTALSPDEGVTAGSNSVSKGGMAVRHAAAELRAELLGAAAIQLEVDYSELDVADGVVSEPSGRSISYWSLAGGGPSVGAEAASTTGELQRWDLPGKFRGEPSFVQDLDLPGTLHGRVVRPPSPTATLATLNTGPTEELPGVVKVVVSGRFIGVVAEREEQALRAVRRIELDAQWDQPEAAAGPLGPLDLLEQEAEETVLDDTLVSAVPVVADTAVTLSAQFSRPFLAHGSIGPSCAVAQADAAGLTVWSHSQGIFKLRAELAVVLGLDPARLRVIHVEGAGCYGHNGADDVALDAALLAREVPGSPIRVQWSRKDEFAWEPYGSAMVVQLDASVDTSGQVSRWVHEVWSHTHSSRPGSSDGVTLLAASHIENPFPAPNLKDPPMAVGGGGLRNAMPLYDFAHRRVVGHFVPPGPVRTSALRGLGTQANVFAIETFMDELAVAANVDPVEFRLRHLTDERARAVIEAVVERSGVSLQGQEADGRGYGIGFAKYKNIASYVAVVAEVEAETDVRLTRVWAVVDAGEVISLDGARNQIEGGILQAASWTLKEQIRFSEGASVTLGWLDYPILTFSEIPELDVHFLDSGHPPLGVGEGAVGPTTAAIGNALGAALGSRVRDLPFTTEQVTRSLLS